MAEFTDREIKIVHAMHSLINFNLRDVPFAVRKSMIMATLKVRGLDYTEQEITDIVLAINAETKLITENALGLLGKYGNILKDMGQVKL